MRRALVLTDEAARHPFRMSLPPHVRRGALAAPAGSSRRISAEDAKLFLMAYCACFIAVSTWIG